MVYAPTTLLPYYMSYEHSWSPTFFMACVHAHAIKPYPLCTQQCAHVRGELLILLHIASPGAPAG
jgi:hypothetical protein